MNSEVNLEQLKALFPIIGRVTERQVLRIQALKKLKRTHQEEDESEQLQKVAAREVLTHLVKLEEWR